MLLALALSCGLCFAESDYTVGISPPYSDIGEIEPGSSKLVNFRILTPSTEPLLIYLEKLDADSGIFHPVPAELSEQSCAEWADIIKNPITIEPMNEPRSYSYADLMLNVPPDAEPGYHRIMVRPSVYVPDQNLGMLGSAVVGVTTFSLTFRVPGEALRSVMILDTLKTDQSTDRMEITTYVQNNGTVTLNARVTQRLGNITVPSSTQTLAPQEIKAFTAYLPLEAFESGKVYQAESVADYATGNATMAYDISLEGEIRKQPSGQQAFQLWVLLIPALALAAAYIYLKRS